VSFVHLHLHTDYSLLDGACRLGDVIERCKAMNMPAVAVTDHGNMFCAVDFYCAAVKRGIRPIIGYEAYLDAQSRYIKTGGQRDTYHLTILARNTTGYHNLMKLASIAYLEGFYYKPRIDMEVIRRYNEGLVILSGCVKSELCTRILNGDYEGAKKTARTFCDIVGREHFFIELQRNGLEEQRQCESHLLRIASELGVGVVATNDVHYIDKEDADAQDVLLCINTGKTVDDPKRMRLGSSEFYFKTPEQMRTLFADIPQAVENTLKIAEMCHPEIESNQLHIPPFHSDDIPDNLKLFRHLCEEGVRRRYPDFDSRQDLQKQLHHEMHIIERTGFVNYFLVVWDIVRYARSKGISVGPGRGSAAGSIVAYSLGITDIDPMKYGLLFERFLNPERISMPDIDIDFPPSGRDEVINYLHTRYGSDCVAQLITFGTLQARAVIRDVARVLEIPLPEVDALAKRIPQGSTIDEALKDDATLASLAADETYNRLFKISRQIEGLSRHTSTHAAGVVIGDKPLIEYCPLYRADGETTTQYPMSAREYIGLMKMDILGLAVLDVIKRSVEDIGDETIEAQMSDLSNKKTYSLLQKGETKGVFQLESDGMRNLLIRIKPTKFEDLIDILALYRPGPLGSGMVENYIKNRKGDEKISYLHPALKEILGPTYGVILYQEQVMRIANVLAGFSLTEADHLRKAMGKKKVEIAEEYREPFIKGAVKRGVPQEIAEKVYSQIAEFAYYGFNKSHSTAYAILAYRTAFLKANFPRHFMAALLTSEEGSSDKLYEYIEDCRRSGIRILPPDINKSLAHFSVEGDCVRYGLTAIKGVGHRTADEIVAKRAKGGEYRSLFDLCERLDTRTYNKQSLEALIKAGALDSINPNRAQLLAVLEEAIETGAAHQRDIEKGQKGLFGSSSSSTIAMPQVNRLPHIPPPSEMQLLAMEKESLGFYLTSHPLIRFKDRISIFSNTTISDLQKAKEKVIIGVIIEGVTKRRSKKGDPYIQLSVSDLTGSTEALVFSRTAERIEPILKEDSVVLLIGNPDTKRSPPSILVNDALTLEDASEKLEGELRLRIEADNETLSKLKTVIEKNPGKTRVKIFISDGEKEAVMRLPREFAITPSNECLQEILSLPGVTIAS